MKETINISQKQNAEDAIRFFTAMTVPVQQAALAFIQGVQFGQTLALGGAQDARSA